jgi:hypothetical protein
MPSTTPAPDYAARHRKQRRGRTAGILRAGSHLDRLHGHAMEEIVIIVLQFLFEFFFEVLSGGVDWPFTSRDHREPASLVVSAFQWLLGGCLLAGVSVLLFKHTLIRGPALRIANLVLAPIASAYLARYLAHRRGTRAGSIIPRTRFWQAFWFTLGLVSLRFAYASRS